MSSILAVMLAVALPAMVGGFSMSMVGCKAAESIARQPEASGDIRTLVLITLAFIETLTIYGLLIAFMLLGKI